MSRIQDVHTVRLRLHFGSLFVELHGNSVADSKGWGNLAQIFFLQKAAFPRIKAYSSLRTFAINDDGTDTSPRH